MAAGSHDVVRWSLSVSLGAAYCKGVAAYKDRKAYC